MNDNDLHTYFVALKQRAAPLPKHQARLRAQLLQQHAHQQTQPLFRLSTFAQQIQGVFSMKRIKTVGLASVAVTALAVGAFTFGLVGESQPAGAAALIDKATVQVQALSAEELAAVQQRVQQNLNQRLAEADRAADARILSPDDVRSLARNVKPDPSAKAIIAYTDPTGDKIVIYIDATNTPTNIVNLTQDGR